LLFVKTFFQKLSINSFATNCTKAKSLATARKQTQQNRTKTKPENPLPKTTKKTTLKTTKTLPGPITHRPIIRAS